MGAPEKLAPLRENRETPHQPDIENTLFDTVVEHKDRLFDMLDIERAGATSFESRTQQANPSFASRHI